MKRISVCMIVRDEEAMLQGCLASVKDLASEIIVVDTGSVDRTKEIAKAARAKVIDHVWNDDFSAARNASIAAASGDFVLIIDADERLAKGAAAVIRKAIAKGGFDCGMMPMHEAKRAGAPIADVVRGIERHGEANYLPRLLRRTPDLAFQGIVHESVIGWLVARGMKVAFVEAPLVHLGATREIRDQRGKRARNIALLEKASALRPDDISLYGYLAHEHIDAGSNEEARAVVARGWPYVERATHGGLASVLRLATARAKLMLDASDRTGVLATVERAERLEGPHPDLDFLRGSAEELEGLASYREDQRKRNLEAALTAYRDAARKRGNRYAQAFVMGASTWAGATRRGAVLLALSRVDEARAAFDEALRDNPDHVEAKLGVAECLLEKGDIEASLATLSPLLDDRPDGWLLGAAAFDALGLVDDFRMYLARARERAGRGYLSPHRRERHAELHGALAAYLGTPTSVPFRSGAVYSLLAREPLPHPEAAPTSVDRTKVQRLLVNLLGVGRGEMMASLLSPRAEQIMPGVGKLVTETLSVLGLSMADDGEPTYAFVGALGDAERETVRELLASHPDLHIIDAQGDLPALHGTEEELRAWMKEQAGSRPRAVFVVDVALLHQERLAAAFPASRFVVFARDVRALVGASSADLLGEPGDMESRAGRWSTIVRGVRASGEAIGSRYLELRYEDLLMDPPAVVRRLLAFLGEAEHPRMLRHLVDAYPGRPDRWRRELALDARRKAESVARETLATLGYEVAS